MAVGREGRHKHGAQWCRATGKRAPSEHRPQFPTVRLRPGTWGHSASVDALWNDLTMATASGDLPDHLLQAVADRTGRITLVVGAGCSLEDPTNLKLSRVYSLQIHADLVRDGVLAQGDCEAPEDLSAVASAVWAKRMSQEEVVTRLPRTEFRNARANHGYRAAAALMREGSVSAVLSLNFDLAMSHALAELSAHDVAVIAGPSATRDLGSLVVVYLHRNVNEDDPNEWILRIEALQEEWQGHWEEVLSQRLISSPIVVFAGLGSPAAVLTESVGWIRQRLDPAQHLAYVVDPEVTTPFQDALNLPDDAHIQNGWCDFMLRMADRLVTRLDLDLREACVALCDDHGWDNERPHIDDLSLAFFAEGLVVSGIMRSKWLMSNEGYAPDEPRGRALLGDLLLGVGLAHRLTRSDLMIRRDGIVELRKDGRVIGTCLPVSGGGVLRWSAIEPRALKLLLDFPSYERPSAVLIAGMADSIPAEVSPPKDIAFGDSDDDVAGGLAGPSFISVDDLRTDPSVAERLAS